MTSGFLQLESTLCRLKPLPDYITYLGNNATYCGKTHAKTMTDSAKRIPCGQKPEKQKHTYTY
jgi:hypothetical protein